MSQSMSLTKFTTHLDEGRSRRRRCWLQIISAPQTFREDFVSVGVVSSTQGTWHNKGQKCSALVQLDEILTVSPLFASCLARADRMPAARARPESPGFPDRRGRRGRRASEEPRASWEKRYCRWKGLLNAGQYPKVFLRNMWLCLFKQGDPGVRGPMGNPGKEGPKVDLRNCAQQNKLQ